MTNDLPNPAKLPPGRLYRPADLSQLAFATTAELTPLPGLAEQPRAREAISLGTGIVHGGFNIFAIGPGGLRIQRSIRHLAEDTARALPPARDWVYVNNFAEPHRPTALALPSGRAPVLQKAIHNLIEDLRAALPALFESEDYQKRRAAVEQSIQAKTEQAFAGLSEKAAAHEIALLRTPMGFGLAPMRDGKVVPPAEFNAWPEDQQKQARDHIHELEKDLEETLRGIPRIEKEQRDALRQLARDTAERAVAPPFEQLSAAFADLPEVLRHIGALRADLIENLGLFMPQEGPQAPGRAAMALGGAFDRYEVNVLVTPLDHTEGAPVIEELNPTLGNLFGRVEHMQVEGALVTNFRLIKAGALHRANGGTILLDALAVLSEPFSWSALKRALRRQEIVIEDISHFMGLTATVSIEPDPIPLEVKVVLVGDRRLYYMLAALDPELAHYFKVLADFDNDAARTPENEAMLARLTGAMAAQNGLLALERGGVERVIEQAARWAGDADKVSLLTEPLHDLITEADHVARTHGRAAISRADVEQAIGQRIRRQSRVRELSHEAILRGISLIDTQGARVGQVNGLSVMSLGDYAFGAPARITCTVRAGAGKIVDIEREVALGGPIHSKGVLILSGYLAGRYALGAPMSLSASLVFEQSYGGVEGDSASSTEAYALLSALSGLALRQDLAVTGSVNQHGEVQAIGGVNEKIEGFFDVCRARGLTGTQGVMIPASNVMHLMLRQDVVEACARGVFAVYPIQTIDEGIALLTGRDAGARGGDGKYPEGSVNQLVEARLGHFAEIRKAAGGDKAQDGGAPKGAA
ncbi:Lon protease family protein [Acidocella sp.]|uniref:Lon protease family protein n=1 Tax=Acidocella sp. TaxID=50710 RepID=UPI002609A181|nr:AAA family ATPase [Acidocella sp.]